MEKYLGVLAACGAITISLGAKPASADVVSDELAALKTVAKCGDPASVWRTWCVATEFATGTAGELPKGKIFVGLALGLEKGHESKDLTEHVSFSALAVDADGKIKLTDITPSSPAEAKMIGEAVASVAVLFKGKTTTAKLPPDMADYVRSRTGEHVAKKVGDEWVWTTTAFTTHLRRVGDTWVVVEVPPKGAEIITTILTDRWE